MSLLPLLWLGILAHHGQHRSVVWWALAIVLGVSWLADTVAHWIDPWLVGMTYPLVQALVLACVLLPTPALWRFALVVLAMGGGALLFGRVGHPDVLARTVAWSGLLVIAWPRRELRLPVAMTFGLGWLGWVAYSVAPGWATWGTYQSIRAIGLGTFCWATSPQPARAR